jgi:hypothetical protein
MVSLYASTRYSKAFLPLRCLERISRTRKMAISARGTSSRLKGGHSIVNCTSSSLNQDSNRFGFSPHTTRYWVVFFWRPGSSQARIPHSRKRCSLISGISGYMAGRALVASSFLGSSASTTSTGFC